MTSISSRIRWRQLRIGIWIGIFVAILISPLQAQFTEYPLPNRSNGPNSIAAGPDGAMWFTEITGFNTGKIGRITTSGSITEYGIPFPSQPYGIAAGPDGALWFDEQVIPYGQIRRITPTAGSITSYPLPSANLIPLGITAGPDGALWFTESGKIGRITTSGSITEYPMPTTDSGPSGPITAGPDGALWFTESTIFLSKIGRITTSGSITEYALPNFVVPQGITTGPDGALWYTKGSASGPNTIGRITTDGSVTEYPVDGIPNGITPGPDGALWFTDRANKIGRITTAGSITEQPVPTADSGLGLIAAGPDGALWFTEGAAGKIGRLLPGMSITITSVGNGASFNQGFAPGMLMSVFGAGLSTGDPQTITTAPLPLTSVSGTSATINGIPAPLLYISATQVNLQIPYEISPGSAVLAISTGGQSGSVNFTVQAAAPGTFVDSQNGRLVPNESATAGSTIGFFLTGAGQVNPSEATGNVPAAGTTPIPDLPVTMTVGGIPVTPVYIGVPNWSIGVLQINFTVPTNLTGSQPVVVKIGGVASQTALLTITSP